MEVKRIRVGGKERWLQLLHYMNNSTAHSFCVDCQDENTAVRLIRALRNTINAHPTWFDMVAGRRGSRVLVVKTKYAQRVVITDDG